LLFHSFNFVAQEKLELLVQDARLYPSISRVPSHACNVAEGVMHPCPLHDQGFYRAFSTINIWGR